MWKVSPKKAPSITISPWAKFSMPMAFQIKTKPNATSAYMLPMLRPEMTCWTANCHSVKADPPENFRPELKRKLKGEFIGIDESPTCSSAVETLLATSPRQEGRSRAMSLQNQGVNATAAAGTQTFRFSTGREDSV